MGYAVLILGVAGMFGALFGIVTADTESRWYDGLLLGYVASWLAMVTGVYLVLA